MTQRKGMRRPATYAELLKDVKQRVRAAQYEALRAVNKELIALYWDIGRLIVERQEGRTWGRAVVENLARDLQVEFPGMRGFSTQNLWRMRQFYETYGRSEKLSPLVREIGWSHNVIIMMHCKDGLQREFYLRMTRKFGWSKNVLAIQIENQAYEKTLLGQTNFDKTVPAHRRDQGRLAAKSISSTCCCITASCAVCWPWNSRLAHSNPSMSVRCSSTSPHWMTLCGSRPKHRPLA